MALAFEIAVADCLYFDQDAALEDQPPHEFARPEIVNELRYGNFRREMTNAGHTVVGMIAAQPEAVIVSANGVPEVPYGCRFAAGCDYLVLVHTVTYQLVAAAECKRRISDEQQYRG